MPDTLRPLRAILVSSPSALRADCMSPRAGSRTVRRFTALGLLLALGGAAWAETSPYYVGGSLGLTRISNPYRASDGTPFPDSAPKDDSYTTLSLLAGIDQPIGRERLYGTARLSDNRWQHNTNLNGRSYDLSGGLDWEASNRWTGTLKAGFNENLALSPVEQLGPSSVATVFDRNVLNTDTVDATIQYGVASRISAVAGIGYRRVGYSSFAFSYLDYSQKNASFSLNYTEGGALTLGIGPHFTRGSYPTATCRFDSTGAPDPRYPCTGDTSDAYTRHDLDFTAKWIASGASNFDSRLSFGRERHSDFQRNKNTDGFTGFILWNWTPTGKLHVNANLQRDTDQNVYFYSLGTGSPSTYSTDSSSVTTALAIGVQYDVSSKIGATASVRYARRPMTNSYGVSSATPTVYTGTDNTTQLALGATWAPTRSTQLGCDISTENRTTTSLQVSSPYSTNSIGCNAQFTLR